MRPPSPIRASRSLPCSRPRHKASQRRTGDQMTNETKERVGIVGVGRMGLAMLKHLVKHGYQVTACDLDGAQLAKAREAGAATAGSPAALGRAADFVILGVGYTDEVNAVVHCPDGLLAALPKGAII